MNTSAKASKATRRGLEAIESDFNDAIDRLLAGRPLNPRLRARSLIGKLKISPFTASLEAGHSRTLVGFDGCRLPSVRRRILELGGSGDTNLSAGTIKSEEQLLRQEIGRLKQEVAAALEGQAQHFLAREQAEREAEKWRTAFRRREEQAREAMKVGSIRSVTPEE